MAIWAAGLCWVGRAEALVYWTDVTNFNTNTVARADLDGSNPNSSFISSAAGSGGVAVGGQYIYWGNVSSDTIGRANINGTGVNETFITGATNPEGVAVDGRSIYWTDGGAIGRANIDGTGVNQTFITHLSRPAGVAVDASYIYWTNGVSTTIGRANLDGTGINRSFITGAADPSGAGVAVTSKYIYWANDNGGAIGRANIDGSAATQGFIGLGGEGSPEGVAVEGQYIYWVNEGTKSIGRANLDGSGVSNSFMKLASEPDGLAVDDLPYPQPVALFTSPSVNYAGPIVPSLFRADASSDPDGQITDYAWSFGDGTTADGVDVSHVFATPGTYQVTLTLTDDHAMADVVSQQIVVAPLLPPVASFTSPSTGYAGPTVPSVFSADGSSDPDGLISDYAWSFGDGTTGDGRDVSHVFATPGTYQVTLTLTDGHGLTSSASQRVGVAGDPPPTVVESQSARRVVTGLPLYLSGAGSSDPDGGITQYSWTFGDGSTASGQSVKHSYGAPGSYTVVLTTTAGNGLTASRAASVEADPPFTLTLARPTNGFVSPVVPMLEWRAAGGDGSDPNLIVHIARGDTDGRTLHAVGNYGAPVYPPSSGYRVPVALPSGTYAWSLSSADPRVRATARTFFFTVGASISITLTSHPGETTAVIRSTSSQTARLIERWHGRTKERRTLRLTGYANSYHFGKATAELPWTCASPGQHQLQVVGANQSGRHADASFRIESCAQRFRFKVDLPRSVSSSQVGQTRVGTVRITDRWRQRDRYRVCLISPGGATTCRTIRSSPHGSDQVRLPFHVAGGRYEVALSADGYLIGSHEATVQVRYPTPQPPSTGSGGGSGSGGGGSGGGGNGPGLPTCVYTIGYSSCVDLSN